MTYSTDETTPHLPSQYVLYGKWYRMLEMLRQIKVISFLLERKDYLNLSMTECLSPIILSMLSFYKQVQNLVMMVIKLANMEQVS